MADNFTLAVKKLLRAAGCHFERQGKGDYEIWYSPVSNRRLMVDAKIKSRPLGQSHAETGRAAEGVLSRPDRRHLTP